MFTEDTADMPLIDKDARLSMEEQFIEKGLHNSTLNNSSILKSKSHCILWLAIPSFVFLTLSNCFFIWQWRRAASEACVRPQLSYTPAKHVIEYERRTLLRTLRNNPFTGEPREELEEAWHNLLSPMIIKITEEELRANGGLASIPFADGSGYMAETAVYHQLHCIKIIRRHLHPDVYYSNATEDFLERDRVHVDHCLEYIRESTMCQGDTTLATFHWKDKKPFSAQFTDHECVKWENIVSWAEERKADYGDNYSLLVKGLDYEAS